MSIVVDADILSTENILKTDKNYLLHRFPNQVLCYKLKMKAIAIKHEYYIMLFFYKPLSLPC